MKQFFKFSILLFIVAGIFSSCKKDEITSPTLSFIGDEGYTYMDVNLAPGDSVKVGFGCNSNGNDDLARLKFTVNDQLISTVTFDAGVKNINMTGYLMKYATDEDNWVFELEDVKGNTSSLTLKITKDLTLADVKDITGVVLGAQENASEKPMYSIADQATYTIADGDGDANIQAKIDFVCYSDDKNGTHLSSPNANWTGTSYDFSAWTTTNETNFILDVPFELDDFGILTKTKIKKAYDDAVAAALPDKIEKRKSKSMAADKMYLFKTYDGKYGVIKVNSVATGTTGSVNFDIKIEK
jgi:hypothetical protein